MSDLTEAAVNNDKFADLYRDGDTVIDFTYRQIVHHSYKVAKRNGDSELMDRIEKAWQEIYSVPYFESEPVPVGILGGPGQGKSSIMKVAAKKAAAFMGLNFVDDKDVLPTKNDFLYDSVTLGGNLSPASIKGDKLPATKVFTDSYGNRHEERVMETILPFNVTASKYARASFINLDDAPNAHPDILTAAYDLLKAEVQSAHSNIFYGFTGNTGQDGAAAKKFNTAIGSRVRLMYMKDTPRDFINRAENRFRGHIAETYIRSISLGFLMQNGHLLNTPPIKGQQDQTNFACSRNWDGFLDCFAQRLTDHVAKMKYAPHLVSDTDIPELLIDIKEMSVDKLGRDVGKKLLSHTLRVLQDADPICRAIMEAGEVTPDIKARIEAQYTNGESPDDMDFMFAMADSLSNHASEQFINAYRANDQDAMDLALKGLVAGLFETLHSPKTPEYVQHVYQRFFHNAVSKSENDPNIGYYTKKGQLLISNPFYDQIVTASTKNIKAVSVYKNGLGNDVRLIDQMGNISNIRAALQGEVDKHAEQAKALREAEERLKPKAQAAPQVAPQPQPANSNTTAQPASVTAPQQQVAATTPQATPQSASMKPYF